MSNVETEKATLEGMTFRIGRTHTPGELFGVLSRDGVSRDITLLSRLFGTDATVGQVLVLFALALDYGVQHSQAMKQMDGANSNLWSSLIDLNDMLGSSYKIRDLISPSAKS